MFPESVEKALLSYLSALSGQKSIRSLDDLEQLSAGEFLAIMEKADDKMLGVVVQYLKSSPKGRDFFDKLMGSHEEENRQLVDSFFQRYMDLVIPDEKEISYYNPLLVYLPPQVFDDLAFVQSRQNFFMRQTIDTINEYFYQIFNEETQFKVDEQERAWAYFWEQITRE